MKIDDSELRELAAELESAGPRVGAKAARAIRRGGKELERTAKQMAPVRSGALKESIEATIYGDGRSGGITAVVGPTLLYGLFQERGTSHHAASPFMGPALEAVAPDVVSKLQDVAGEVFE